MQTGSQISSVSVMLAKEWSLYSKHVMIDPNDTKYIVEFVAHELSLTLWLVITRLPEQGV